MNFGSAELEIITRMTRIMIRESMMKHRMTTNNQTTSVLIALGANLGSCSKQIESAWNLLGANPHISPILISSFIATKPVGGPKDQPDYLNAAALLKTDLSPFDLLDLLQKIEFQGGRRRHTFWGPRSIDLDILLYGDAVINTSRLVVPHPRMAWRPFVLVPSVEVAPDMLHPVFRMTIKDVLNLSVMNFRLSGMLGFLSESFS